MVGHGYWSVCSITWFSACGLTWLRSRPHLLGFTADRMIARCQIAAHWRGSDHSDEARVAKVEAGTMLFRNNFYSSAVVAFLCWISIPFSPSYPALIASAGLER